jgi:coenzyme F420-reducing hydrogenase delta subunit
MLSGERHTHQDIAAVPPAPRLYSSNQRLLPVPCMSRTCDTFIADAEARGAHARQQPQVLVGCQL